MHQQILHRSEPRRWAALFGAIAGLALCWLAASSAAAAEPRVALVIGNGQYDASIGQLANPTNDAAVMADKLGALGFRVIKLVNGDQKAMKRAISDFGEQLLQAGPDAVGLFFYAGHGIQIGGDNYLIPVDADLTREADAEIEAVNAQWVLQQMQYAGNRVNIVILDACRNNPLSRGFRSSSRGLARMDAPTGTFIGYSTAPGEVAADGNGRNSPYVAALAAEIDQPGVPLEETFRNVRVRVMGATAERQVPWDSSSLTGAFYFKPGAKVVSVAPAVTPTPVVPAAPAGNGVEAGETEKIFWQSIKDSSDPAEFDAYLARYPNGIFSDLARAKLARLANGNVASVERSPEPLPAPAPAPAPAPSVVAPAPAVVAPAPVPAAVEPSQQEPESPPASVDVPAGTIVLSAAVAGQLDNYLRGIQHRNAAFAVSPDGQYFGSFTCQLIEQCVAGPRSLQDNRDRRAPQKKALQQCQSRAKQPCILLMIRDDKRAEYVRP